jgi:pilus assembly protein Flp/PilA
MKSLIRRFARDESGTAAIEYGLLSAMIAVPIVSAARDLGFEISKTFDKIADAMR